MKLAPARLLWITDLGATVVFAVEGAAAGAAAGFDVFGVTVLGFVTALGGGVIRDVILGERPPAALRGYSYLAAVAVGAGGIIVAYQWIDRIPHTALTYLDAAGLALFAVTGAAKALDHGLNPVSAVLLGTVTGAGGGVVRDVLLNQVPRILHSDIYAVAGALGATVTVLVLRLGHPRIVAFALGAAACFVLRVLAVELSWNLPRLRG